MKQLPIPEIAALFQLDPEVAFLNHGSFGACPRPVFESYQHWQRELEREPVLFLGRRINGLLEEARTTLGDYVGASAQDLVFVPNATYGVNVVARSLELGPEDEVLGSDHEYGAVDRTWRFLASQRGFQYTRQHVALPLETPEQILEQFWAGVTERTRVICISHITSPTALIFPIAEICRRARAAGILTIIDGAHAPGQLDLDMQAIGADFYTGNCHKWLCAPKGSGFLYARPDKQHLLKPLVVSWGYESMTPSGSVFQDLFGWTGTHDPAAYLSVPAAIAFQKQHGWHDIRLACHQLVAQAREHVAALTGLPQVYPDDQKLWVQMCILPIPAQTRVSVQDFWNYDQVEIPVTFWGEQQFVRISVQGYTQPEHIERLVKAVKGIFSL